MRNFTERGGGKRGNFRAMDIGEKKIKKKMYFAVCTATVHPHHTTYGAQPAGSVLP